MLEPSVGLGTGTYDVLIQPVSVDYRIISSLC
jgi:hypothetical protein